MSWRVDEVWLDTEMLWFREESGGPFGGLALAVPGAGDVLDQALYGPVATGLEASRQRRQARQAERRRRRTTRTVPAVALVLGSTTMLPISTFRPGLGQESGALGADPPSLASVLDDALLEPAEPPVPRRGGPPSGKPAARAEARATSFARVEWRRASAVGLPYAGRLVNGTQLPVEGPNWVTWNPATDSTPNLPNRLYGHERTIRTIISVLAAYRTSHDAQRVVIGDISFRHGSWMDQHVSHQNGLDVDVYYPRLDRRLSPPIARSQIDRRLAQDLLDRFIAAGAQVVFVGYSTDLRGPGDVVVPYPRHENHMHVRFPAPPG